VREIGFETYQQRGILFGIVVANISVFLNGGGAQHFAPVLSR